MKPFFAIFESKKGWKQLIIVTQDPEEAIKQTAILHARNKPYNYTAYMSDLEGGFFWNNKFCRNGKLLGIHAYNDNYIKLVRGAH